MSKYIIFAKAGVNHNGNIKYAFELIEFSGETGTLKKVNRLCRVFGFTARMIWCTLAEGRTA